LMLVLILLLVDPSAGARRGREGAQKARGRRASCLGAAPGLVVLFEFYVFNFSGASRSLRPDSVIQ
jgi:hypothetical protein